jgi:hypothetical protein
MLTLTQRLGTLDAKAKFATRTAKDGEEYSQLVFEVTELEVTDTEVNAIFATPNAFMAIKALHKAVKGVKAIELEEKIEGATVVVRLAAVSAKNGPEFTFNDCRIDKLKLAGLESDALQCSYRVTAKPALNAHFGELVARFGHTAMIELRGESPNAQADLPLNTAGASERGTSSIGTPEQERERAAKRERKIARQIEDDRNGEEKPARRNRKSAAAGVSVN